MNSFVQPDTPLFMECVDEELSEAQQEFFKKKQDEFKVCIKTIFLSSLLITALSLPLAFSSSFGFFILFLFFKIFFPHVFAKSVRSFHLLLFLHTWTVFSSNPLSLYIINPFSSFFLFFLSLPILRFQSSSFSLSLPTLLLLSSSFPTLFLLFFPPFFLSLLSINIFLNSEI